MIGSYNDIFNIKQTEQFCNNFINFSHEISTDNSQIIKPIPIKKKYLKKNMVLLGKKRNNANKNVIIFNSNIVNNIYENSKGNENNNICKSVFKNSEFSPNSNTSFTSDTSVNNIFIFNCFQNQKVTQKNNIRKTSKGKINLIINNYTVTNDENENKNLIDNNGKKLFKPMISKNDILKNTVPINNINKTNISENKTNNDSNNKNNSIIEKNENNMKEKENFKKFKIIRNYDRNEEKTGENSNNNEKLITSNRKKRGRKPKKENKREHNAFDQDNIIRKIQVHFLSFIIYFANDLIQIILPNRKDLNFKNINYELKKTVNHAYMEKLKSKNVGEILQFNASPKNKKFESSINQKTYEIVCNISPFLKQFFEMSYLEMFALYYTKPTREFNVGNYQVTLSQRTRLLIDLINKNKESGEKIKEIANQFFSYKKKETSQIFVINKK